jgi:glyoxylase-like metal-dependent hydrolase (beta-lactamase superfamily II)
MRRVLKVVGGLLAVGVLAVLGLGYATFGGLPPIPDGAVLQGFVRVVKDGYVSAYVLDEGDGKVALVDAGNDAAGTALLAELTRRGLGPDAVADILLTHGHPDHTAGVHLFPKAQVYALAAEVPLVEGKVAAKGPLPRLFPASDNGARVTHAVQNGDRIPLGSHTAEALAVPGHTAGSAAWLVDGVLFLGDSADATKDGKLVGAKYIFSDDPAQNEASLHALANVLRSRRAEVRVLACAHTGTLDGPDALLAW